MVAGILYIIFLLVCWFIFYAFFFEDLVSKSWYDIDTLEGLLISLVCALAWPLVLWGFIILKFTPVVKGWKEKRKLLKEQEKEQEYD